MRVTGGTWKGRSLKGPSWQGTRPATDRVREAIGSILTTRDAIRGARVLDLFAGTGAYGIEALSRGASSAVFVDRNARALATIETNIRALDQDADVHLVSIDLLRDVDVAVRRLSDFSGDLDGRFNLIFFAPPYADFEHAALLIDRCVTAKIVSADAWFVIEQASRTPEFPFKMLDDVRTYHYGDTLVSVGRAMSAAE